MNRRDFIKGLGIAALGAKTLLMNACDDSRSESKTSDLESYLISDLNEIKKLGEVSLNDYFIVINGAEQQLYLAKNNGDYAELIKSYVVSTGRGGFGGTPGSKKTPLGVLKIKEKNGEGAPIGTVFYGGKPSKQIVKINNSSNKTKQAYVLTRALILKGLEEENKTTEFRRIYIHATNEEGLLGKPVSHGCIRMGNQDIVDLYSRINPGTYVLIKK